MPLEELLVHKLMDTDPAYTLVESWSDWSQATKLN